MPILASDDFSGLGAASINGRTLNNALGGSGVRSWLGNFDGDGSGAVGSTSVSGMALVSEPAATKMRVRVNPNSGADNMILWARRGLDAPETGVALLLVGQTSLRLSAFQGGERTDHQTLGITAPQAAFWMELEISGLLVTCRILGDDTSVRDTVSHAFASSVPSGGAYWGFGFFQDGHAAKFDDVVIYDDGGSGADEEPPELVGAITINAKTSSTIAMSWPAGSDNVGVTSYEVSSNGGASWTNVGNVLAHTFTGLAPLTSHDLSVRAKDAADNASAPLSATTSTYRAGDTAANILANTAAADGHPAGFMYGFAAAVPGADWLSYTIVSGPTPAGELNAYPDGSFTYVGPSPSTLVIQPEVNGANAPETITVTLYDVGTPDTERPTLAGAITLLGKTHDTITVSCPAGADNVGVAGYDWSKDGGATWVAGTQLQSFTGLAAATAYPVRVRVRDAAGYTSTPPLALSVTTDAAPVAPPPVLSAPTGTAAGATGATGGVSTDKAGGTLYFLASTSGAATAAAVKAGSSQAVVAAGAQAVAVAALAPSTTYYLHFLHRDAAGGDSAVATSAAFTTGTQGGGIDPRVFSSKLRRVQVKDDQATVLGRYTKRPSELLDYCFNFGAWLDDCGDSIADHQVVVSDAGLTVQQQGRENGLVAAFVSAGENGKAYKLTCRITTVAGRAKEANISITVQEPMA